MKKPNKIILTETDYCFVKSAAMHKFINKSVDSVDHFLVKCIVDSFIEHCNRMEFKVENGKVYKIENM